MRPGSLLAAIARAARWTAQHTCAHHWHPNCGSVVFWACCACGKPRDSVPTRDGRACARPHAA